MCRDYFHPPSTGQVSRPEVPSLSKRSDTLFPGEYPFDSHPPDSFHASRKVVHPDRVAPTAKHITRNTNLFITTQRDANTSSPSSGSGWITSAGSPCAVGPPPATTPSGHGWNEGRRCQSSRSHTKANRRRRSPPPSCKHTQMNMKAREGQPSAANAVVQPASLIIRD